MEEGRRAGRKEGGEELLVICFQLIRPSLQIAKDLNSNVGTDRPECGRSARAVSG